MACYRLNITQACINSIVSRFWAILREKGCVIAARGLFPGSSGLCSRAADPSCRSIIPCLDNRTAHAFPQLFTRHDELTLALGSRTLRSAVVGNHAIEMLQPCSRILHPLMCVPRVGILPSSRERIGRRTGRHIHSHSSP